MIVLYSIVRWSRPNVLKKWQKKILIKHLEKYISYESKGQSRENELSMKNEFTHIDVQLYMNYYKIN